MQSRADRGWNRDADADALPFLGGMLPPMADLRGRALTATLQRPEALSD